MFSETPQEHIKRLHGFFAKLASAALKLKPNKCEFFKKKITYLGHVVSEEGIEVDPKKTEAVKKWPIPKTVTDVRSFLGFTNQYRKFIPKYAHLAAPLNQLVSGDNSKKKKKEVQWTPECQEAFEALKEHCCTTPVLAYANYKKPFRLHTDASDLGLGAVLYQQDKTGKNRVIAYASRMLSQSEKNYPAHKLEFLALKWAVINRSHEYLYGGEFSVYTDNNPLTYVLTRAKLDATGQRWIAALANYNRDCSECFEKHHSAFCAFFCGLLFFDGLECFLCFFFQHKCFFVPRLGCQVSYFFTFLLLFPTFD